MRPLTCNVHDPACWDSLKEHIREHIGAVAVGAAVLAALIVIIGLGLLVLLTIKKCYEGAGDLVVTLIQLLIVIVLNDVRERQEVEEEAIERSKPPPMFSKLTLKGDESFKFGGIQEFHGFGVAAKVQVDVDGDGEPEKVPILRGVCGPAIYIEPGCGTPGSVDSPSISRCQWPGDL